MLIMHVYAYHGCLQKCNTIKPIAIVLHDRPDVGRPALLLAMLPAAKPPGSGPAVIRIQLSGCYNATIQMLKGVSAMSAQ